MYTGFSEIEIVRAIVDAAAREKPRALRQAVGDLGVWARVLARWAEDPQFASEAGVPLDLSERGPGISFHRLVAAELPGAAAEDGLAVLLATRSITRLANGLLRWRSRTAIGHKGHMIFVDEYLRPLRALLVTLEDNLNHRVSGRSDLTFARGISGLDIPETELEELRRIVESQGMIFIEAIDNWLKARATDSRQRTARKSRIAHPYIGVFMTGHGRLPPTAPKDSSRAIDL